MLSSCTSWPPKFPACIQNLFHKLSQTFPVDSSSPFNQKLMFSSEFTWNKFPIEHKMLSGKHFYDHLGRKTWNHPFWKSNLGASVCPQLIIRSRATSPHQWRKTYLSLVQKLPIGYGVVCISPWGNIRIFKAVHCAEFKSHNLGTH